MAKIKNNIAETGIAETLCVLMEFTHCEDVMHRAQMYMPFPEDDINQRIDAIASGLALLGKDRLLLLTPEIAIIEKLIQYNACKELIVCLPHQTGEEARSAIAANMPQGIPVSFISDNEIPLGFTQDKAAVVAFGFCEGERSIILSSTYRLMRTYASFCGNKVIAYCGHTAGQRPAGWLAVNTHHMFNLTV